MAFPYLDNPATLTPSTVQELDGLVTKLNTFLRQQHGDDGGHGDITADSVTVDGPVTVRDENQFPSSFVRNVALGTRIDIRTNPVDPTPSFTVRLGIAPDATPAVIELGTGLASGGTGLFVGVRLDAGIGFIDWRMLTGVVAAAPAWLLVDGTNNVRPFTIIRTGGRYDIRPDTVTPVGLGNAPAGQRFDRGYIDNVFATNTFERGRTVSAGDWQTVPYNAANFTASAGTWGVDPGDILTQRYTLIGQTLHYATWIVGTNVSAAPGELLIALPTGYLVGTSALFSMLYRDAGSAMSVGFCYGVAGQAVLHLSKFGSAWTTTAANNTEIYLSLSCEVTG